MHSSAVPTDASGSASAFAATWDCVCKNGISGKTCTEDQIAHIYDDSRLSIQSLYYSVLQYPKILTLFDQSE